MNPHIRPLSDQLITWRPNVLLFASSIIALFLLGAVFILRTNLNQELKKQLLWSETSLIATDRAITQLQRELLKLVYLIESEADMDAINLQVEIVESRVFYFQQFAGQEIIPSELRQNYVSVDTQWTDIQPLIVLWQNQPDAIQNQESLTNALLGLEIFTNDIISRLSVIRAQSLKNSTERLHFLSNLIGVTLSFLVLFLAITSFSTIRFIQDRRKASIALTQNEELFRLLFESAATGIVLFSLDGRFLRVNSAFNQMVGFSQEELLTKTLKDLTHPDDIALNQELMQKISEGHISSTQFEKRCIHKQGHTIFVLMALSMITSPDGHPRHIIAQISDITERKKSEEVLRQTQKLESIGLLAGGIAHDFNNLLTAILTQNSMAASKLPRNHPVQDNIAKVMSASERAADLTRQLLAYTGKGQFQVKPINLNHIVSENLKLLEATLPKHVALNTDLETPLPYIDADVGHMQQVIMNLVINGAEAIEDHTGFVQVKTTVLHFNSEKPTLGSTHLKPGQYVCLQVEDNGSGIEPETQERIFEPFFTTKADGRGLGLSAILGIIRSHSGGLHLTSEVGQGTTIQCYFPVSQRVENIAITTSIDQEPLSSEPISVLVIDDEAPIREAVIDILSTVEINVFEAENGLVGLEIYKQHQDQITVILLDMNMPVMGGLETMEAIYQVNPNVKIILSSGYTETRPLALKNGADQASFLYKPYKIKDLLDKIYK